MSEKISGYDNVALSLIAPSPHTRIRPVIGQMLDTSTHMYSRGNEGKAIVSHFATQNF